MRIRSFLAAAALLVCGVALADVRIPEQHRVRNRPPGFCSWVCLETLGRFHGIDRLKGLIEQRMKDPDEVIYVNGRPVTIPRHVGCQSACEAKLRSLGVKFKTSEGYNDRAFLIAACQSQGCMVFMRPGAFVGPDGQTGGHAVILTGYDYQYVEFLDLNTASYWHAGRDWFDKYYVGYALTVENTP